MQAMPRCTTPSCVPCVTSRRRMMPAAGHRDALECCDSMRTMPCPELCNPTFSPFKRPSLRGPIYLRLISRWTRSGAVSRSQKSASSLEGSAPLPATAGALRSGSRIDCVCFVTGRSSIHRLGLEAMPVRSAEAWPRVRENKFQVRLSCCKASASPALFETKSMRPKAATAAWTAASAFSRGDDGCGARQAVSS